MSAQALQTYALSRKLTEFDNRRDIAMFLDTEGFLDEMYAQIAIGEPYATLADAIGLDHKTLDFALKRTPSHQQKLLAARAVHLGSASADQLELIGADPSKHAKDQQRYLDREENNMVRHHRGMFELGIKAAKELTTPDVDENDNRVIVHNVVQVLNSNEPPPPMPTELNALLEAN